MLALDRCGGIFLEDLSVSALRHRLHLEIVGLLSGGSPNMIDNSRCCGQVFLIFRISIRPLNGAVPCL